ncbi:MAG: hypothetical protein HY075_01045 [Deltaproteobacteria bacterium]|nr:hypothetical protein [Deltaproteobacteria bacterium]
MPVGVDVPVDAFGRKTNPPPLRGSVWTSEKPTTETRFRGVLLVPDPSKPKGAYEKLGGELSDAGFNTLLIEPRKNESQPQRTLIEDIQSGVGFMKTDKRVGAVKVLVVANGAAANAAAHYAAAGKQMSLIVDGVVLLSPDQEVKRMKLSDAIADMGNVPLLLASTKGDVLALAKKCRNAPCRPLKSADDGKTVVAKQAILEFLLRPHGQ